jgi:glycosyltransferase involved in cell wall biosynthesis
MQGAGNSGLRVLYLSGGARASTLPDAESVGPRAHILGVIDALEDLGATVDRYIAGDRSPEAFTRQGSDIALQRNWLTRAAGDALRAAMNAVSTRRVRRMVSACEYSFAYERYALFQSLGRAARRRGVPWVLEVNALLAHESTSTRRATNSRRLAEWAERHTLIASDLIVAVTEELAASIANAYDISRSKIIVVPNGVDAKRFARVPPRTTDGTLRIGFVGSMYPWQNIPALMDAVSELPAGTVELVLAGDGPEMDTINRQARTPAMLGKVTLLGRVHPDSVPSLLEQVDICYAGHSSTSGGYFSPLKLWEYLAAGRPVLLADGAMSRALASDGASVVLFEPENADSLRGALRHAMDRRAVLAERAQAARAAVARQHSWTARVEGLVAELAERRLL